MTLVATDSSGHVVATGSSSSHQFTIGTIAYHLTAGDLDFYGAKPADLGAALQDLLDDLD